MTMADQLNAGVRYFDLRAAPRPATKPARKKSSSSSQQEKGDHDSDNDDRLYGPRIVELCHQVNEFLNTHPGEVVVVHIQHFLDTNCEQQKHLLDQIQDIFGSKLIPFRPGNRTPTLESMSKNKFQVILFYPSNCPLYQSTKECPDIIWPAELLPNPWANTTSEDFLRSFLTVNVSKRSADRFYVTQGVLTPSDRFIKRHLLSSLKSKLVIKCNESLVEWMDQELENKSGPKGPNIVMTDFIEWNNKLIPRIVVNFNYTTDTDNKS